jgi:hypothetical protein
LKDKKNKGCKVLTLFPTSIVKKQLFRNMRTERLIQDNNTVATLSSLTGINTDKESAPKIKYKSVNHTIMGDFVLPVKPDRVPLPETTRIPTGFRQEDGTDNSLAKKLELD